MYLLHNYTNQPRRMLKKAYKKQIWPHSKPCIYGSVGGKPGGGEGVREWKPRRNEAKNGQKKDYVNVPTATASPSSLNCKIEKWKHSYIT